LFVTADMNHVEPCETLSRIMTPALTQSLSVSPSAGVMLRTVAWIAPSP